MFSHQIVNVLCVFLGLPSAGTMYERMNSKEASPVQTSDDVNQLELELKDLPFHISTQAIQWQAQSSSENSVI